jgi:hypothetical protein
VKRLAGTIALLLALVGAESAPAATEVGSRCEGDTLLVAGIEGIVFPLATDASGALPTSSPISGVATQWSVRSGSTDTWVQRLKILRADTEAGNAQIVGEAPPQPVTKGSGPFPIRIPVQAGDRFGLNRPGGGALACNTGSPGDRVGETLGNGQPGQSEPFFPSTGYQLPLVVTIEPDIDGDGYGDETQEPCPNVITVQVPCPPVTFEQNVEAKKRAILVQAEVSSQASVQVFGRIGWQVRPSGDRDRRLIVGLNGGPACTVLPDRSATFRLPLGKAVKRRLGRLDASQSLRAKLTVRVIDLAGRVTTQRIRLRLPGRG